MHGFRVFSSRRAPLKPPTQRLPTSPSAIKTICMKSFISIESSSLLMHEATRVFRRAWTNTPPVKRSCMVGCSTRWSPTLAYSERRSSRSWMEHNFSLFLMAQCTSRCHLADPVPISEASSCRSLRSNLGDCTRLQPRVRWISSWKIYTLLRGSETNFWFHTPSIDLQMNSTYRRRWKPFCLWLTSRTLLWTFSISFDYVPRRVYVLAWFNTPTLSLPHWWR
mmetsp:Transcript_3758/g.11638  ORF Transcript_3758/g.11638 Transcript_3758/m.11638 type:complete len:222 (+) Transcript_3758:623-1288(+)